MSVHFNPSDYPMCLQRPDRLVQPGAWIQHIPFAMYLVSAIKPGVIVELGTHTGNSYCAFCQTVKAQGIDSRCYAVDSWHGDPQAGYYGDEVYNELRSYHDLLYGRFSQMIRSTFDEAVTGFTDHSIDLLHIDGLHTYEAVRHDFFTWLPKVQNGGIVLFHDTYERQSDFGVWKLWEELMPKYPSFEFLHGHGLGVLAVGTPYPAPLKVFFEQPDQTSRIRECFSLLGGRLEYELSENSNINEMRQEIAHLKKEVSDYQTSTSWRFTRPLRAFSGLLRKKS